ncbi:MAG TPA: aminotransferase class V-fold PLP-dependent enzyme [Chloroflexota bacterium]|nr:aminotransferase class V-fold PLP-dependent enzyme [Chloroflexota bacterium]
MSTLETARGAADVYGRLGMAPIINGSGTVTILGGTLMSEEVLAAMNAAARSYVDLPAFLERAGRYLAERIGVPGAFISSGAAGGIAVAVAAVLSGGERERAWALPRTDGRPNEIVVLKTKGANYMHQAAEMVGGKLVEVGEPGGPVTVDDFAAAIGPQTAAILYVYPYVEATLKEAGNRAATLTAVGKVARERGVPVLVDAAAELPPREKLTRFHQEGGDLVIFSGGKGVCGPQSTGLVVGRADLIASCLLNSNPNSSVGRAMKVGKEEVAGLVRAVELFLERDEAAVFAEWKRRGQVIADRLQGIPGVTAQVIENDGRSRPPEAATCFVTITDGARLSAKEIVTRLAQGTPSIRVRPLPDGFFICAMTLRDGEDAVIGEEIARILEG